MGDKNKFFKWWYAKEVSNYGKLLKEQTATIIGLTSDEEELIQKTVPIHIEEDGIAVADYGPEKGKYYLSPTQMVSKEGALKNFWLVDIRSQKWDTANIIGTYTALENDKAVMFQEKEVRLFGKSEHEPLATFGSYPVSAIFPIGEGNYIAWDRARNTCILIGDRETNETEIKILMEKTG